MVAILVSLTFTRIGYGEKFARSDEPLPIEIVGEHGKLLDTIRIASVEVIDVPILDAFKTLEEKINADPSVTTPFKIAFEIDAMRHPSYIGPTISLRLADISPLESLRYFTTYISASFKVYNNEIIIVSNTAEQGAAANP